MPQSDSFRQTADRTRPVSRVPHHQPGLFRGKADVPVRGGLAYLANPNARERLALVYALRVFEFLKGTMPGTAQPSDCFGETRDFTVKHYSPAEIAKMWKLSADTVRRLFEREPGVLVLSDPRPTRRKRRYTTLRIPENVLARVHKRLTRV
jgi:hypothetical protein